MNFFHTNKKKNIKGVRRISDVVAPVATITVSQIAAPIGGSAPIEMHQLEVSAVKAAPKADSGKSKAESSETKPTVTIPPPIAEHPETPSVTSPTPPQTPASTATPPIAIANLKAVHEVPGTPPVGGTTQKPPTTEAPQKKK